MKPLHSDLVYLSRCPCCASRFSKHRTSNKNGSTNNTGASAARQYQKRELNKQLRDLNRE